MYGSLLYWDVTITLCKGEENKFQLHLFYEEEYINWTQNVEERDFFMQLNLLNKNG